MQCKCYLQAFQIAAPASRLIKEEFESRVHVESGGSGDGRYHRPATAAAAQGDYHHCLCMLYLPACRVVTHYTVLSVITLLLCYLCCRRAGLSTQSAIVTAPYPFCCSWKCCCRCCCLSCSFSRWPSAASIVPV